MVTEFCKKVLFVYPQNVLEISCGSGAFICATYEIMDVNLYDVVYSQSSIGIAQRAILCEQFISDDAVKQNFSNTSFDVVFSHSVFHYFYDETYITKVLENWCAN